MTRASTTRLCAYLALLLPATTALTAQGGTAQRGSTTVYFQCASDLDASSCSPEELDQTGRIFLPGYQLRKDGASPEGFIASHFVDGALPADQSTISTTAELTSESIEWIWRDRDQHIVTDGASGNSISGSEYAFLLGMAPDRAIYGIGLELSSSDLSHGPLILRATLVFGGQTLEVEIGQTFNFDVIRRSTIRHFTTPLTNLEHTGRLDIKVSRNCSSSESCEGGIGQITVFFLVADAIFGSGFEDGLDSWSQVSP